ncbi:hypothetical protein JOF59_006403 [Streptomyces clavifer]|uniref:Uncharacterized protein n=1 Tax=Streptomyces clavifer TaxID=68188 RepID=A0ABS4VJD9_9ACTN|nr:hypothetical protein [Streptomyces clavifer]
MTGRAGLEPLRGELVGSSTAVSLRKLPDSRFATRV